MSFYADRGYRAVPDAVHRHEVEASGRDHSQSYSIPRKPVPSQSSYSYRLATDDGNIYAEQVSDTDRCRDRELQPSFDSQAANGLGISQDSPRADSAQSLALWSGVRGAHLESQRDSLLPQASAPAGIATPRSQDYNWVPNTLKWSYLLLLIFTSLGLAAIVGVLTWYSTAHTGLGDDTGSTILLFGWRFTPTLVAVIYVLLETMLLADVRRTEVFAQLVRNTTSSATATLLRNTDSWWNDPRAALRKQNEGGWRGWALFWSSFANILGILIISPLSAGLLATEDMQITTNTAFDRVNAFRNAPLRASADDATFVRAIASSTVGLTTSAWLSNEYAVLPFWPSGSDKVPFGSTLATSAQTWLAKTTVFHVDLDCDPMWLSEAGYQPAQIIEPPPYLPKAVTLVPSYTSIQLSSEDGCIYEFAISAFEDVDFFDLGGGWWSNTSGESYPASAISVPNTEDGPTIVVANSSQCDNRNIFFITTPFRNASTRAVGHVCSSAYYQADIEITVSISASQSSISFDERLFQQMKRPMSTLFDTQDFEALFLGAQWATKFQPPTSSNTLPFIGGPLLTIAALHNWDLESMMTNASVLKEAKAIKQRFLGEALQNTFTSIGSEDAISTPGRTILLQSRVVVNFAIGVTLCSLFFLSALMFVAVLFFSRPHKRPLGLMHDPASAAATSSLISREGIVGCFEWTDKLSQASLNEALEGTLFTLNAGELSIIRGPDQSKIRPTRSSGHDKENGWCPTVLHGWSGAGALLFITTIMGGIVALFVKSKESSLYQTIFVYQKNFSIGGGIIADIAPYSIIPTLLAIIIKLWWGALESTFKRLQPFIAMTRRPTKASEGITLSYVDTFMLWASWKAKKNRHWLLALITLGAFLTEVFTVGMSALWNRQGGVLSDNRSMARHFELRTIPQIFLANSNPQDPDSGNTVVKSTLVQIYGTVLNGWLYGGLVDLAYNGSRPMWTSDDLWAFAPVDNSNLTLPKVQKIGSNTTTDDSTFANAPANMTVDTPGMRARLECTELDMSNTSAWLQTLDFTNHSIWNQTTVPPSLETGFSLGTIEQGFFPIDLGKYKKVWKGNVTTFFVDNSQIVCCANETQGNPGRVAIGYWSINAAYTSDLVTNFTVKWIVGEPYQQQVQLADSPEGALFVWKSPPKMTALNCVPVFETVAARVTVDVETSTVQSHTLMTLPTNSRAAWSDPWLLHGNLSQIFPPAGYGFNVPINVTVSYGWLFLQSLLTAADTNAMGDDEGGSYLTYPVENLYDRTFNFRQTGLNADFMSYSALALQDNDIEALLDAQILYETSNHVFGTFFQHFVGDNVSMESGSYGFQKIDAAVPWDLGPAYGLDGGEVLADHQDLNDTHHLSGTIDAVLHIRIEQLHMSPTAVYLCLSILAFLAATTIWVYTKHRQYFKALPRDVDNLASVLAFVYASPKLLRWVEEHKHEKHWGLRNNSAEPMVRMGWFDGGHWGIELLDEGEGIGTKAKHESSSLELSDEREALATGMSPRS